MTIQKTAMGYTVGWILMMGFGTVVSLSQPALVPTVKAQAPETDATARPRSVLTFRSTAAGTELSQLQLTLTQVVTALPVENTTLPAEVLGTVELQDAKGEQSLTDYTWKTTPTSRLYLGRSGYKSLKVRYQYGKSRASLPYTLDIACQTVGLKAQNRAVCDVFGNGPLLTGEVKAEGQLTLEEAIAQDTTAPLTQTPTTQTNLTKITYLGKGALVMYPTTAKDTEKRYGLTRMTLDTTNAKARLTVIAADPTPKTMVFQGKLEAGDRGQILTVTTLDGMSGQGKIFIGKDGTFRTVAPIFVGEQDQELSLYFRSSEP